MTYKKENKENYKYVGETVDEKGQFCKVFECLKCKHRTVYCFKECANCEKIIRKVIKEHHELEAEVGIL